MEKARAEEEEVTEKLAQLESIVKQRMTKEAQQRFGNIKLAHPQKAAQTLITLGHLIQEKEIIDDITLKTVLKKL